MRCIKVKFDPWKSIYSGWLSTQEEGYFRVEREAKGRCIKEEGRRRRWREKGEREIKGGKIERGGDGRGRRRLAGDGRWREGRRYRKI